MRSDNTKKRRKSHGWPFAAIHGFFSAFYYAYTDLIAVSLHVCRFHIFQNNRQEEYDMYFDQNQMIISKNPQFTGISARQQLEFTTHLLLTD